EAAPVAGLGRRGQRTAAGLPAPLPGVTDERLAPSAMGPSAQDTSEDVAAQVGVLHQFAQVRIDVGAVDGDAAAALVGSLVAEGVEQALEHGVQATRADVLLALVDLGGDLGQAVDGVGGERELHALGPQQLDVRSEEHTSELQS